MEREAFDRELDALLLASEQGIPNVGAEDLTESSVVPGVPQWHPFEHFLWAKGEEIRQVILKSGKKPNAMQLERICAICTNPYAGRGRQSFVLLLGKKGYASFAPVIAQLLGDRAVDGQVIDTLYKMGAPGYRIQISAYVADERTWVRNLAKRYLEKYG